MVASKLILFGFVNSASLLIILDSSKILESCVDSAHSGCLFVVLLTEILLCNTRIE